MSVPVTWLRGLGALVVLVAVLFAVAVLVRLEIGVVTLVQLVAGVAVAVLGTLLLRHFPFLLQTSAAHADDDHKTYLRPEIFPVFP